MTQPGGTNGKNAIAIKHTGEAKAETTVLKVASPFIQSKAWMQSANPTAAMKPETSGNHKYDQKLCGISTNHIDTKATGRMK